MLARVRTSPLETAAVAGLAVVAVALVWIAAGGGALGHDEAAMALKARSWVEGTADTGWSIHRGVGASVLALPVVALTDSAFALRLLAVGMAVATVGAVWYLGSVVGSRRAATMAAAVYVASFSFLRRGAEFLTDVPSTGLLVLSTAFLWRWLTEQETKNRQLYLAVALGVASVYIRYQAALTLALLAITVVAVFWSGLRHRMAVVGKALSLGLGLIAPLFIWATVAAGSPWSPFLAAAEAGGRSFVGEGLVDYLRDFPYFLSGPVGAGVILVALGWFLVQTVLTRRGRKRRLALFMVLPALAQIGILGLVSHGEPRFVFYPVVLLVVAGSVALDDWGRSLSSRSVAVAAAVLAAVLLVALSEAASRADRQAESRAEGFMPLVATSEVAASEADRCELMTGQVPQVTWITRCPAYLYDLNTVAVPEAVRSGGAMLVFEDGLRQPSGSLLEEYVREAGSEPIVVNGTDDGDPDGRVYLFPH